MIHVSFVGYLGADAKLGEADGTPVLNFRVGVKGGIQKDAPTEWVACAMWGTRGEKIEEFMTTGKQVLVTGTLTTREFEHKGEQRFSLECRVAEVELLGGGSDEDTKSDEKPKDKKNGSRSREERAR